MTVYRICCIRLGDFFFFFFVTTTCDWSGHRRSFVKCHASLNIRAQFFNDLFGRHFSWYNVAFLVNFDWSISFWITWSKLGQIRCHTGHDVKRLQLTLCLQENDHLITCLHQTLCLQENDHQTLSSDTMFMTSYMTSSCPSRAGIGDAAPSVFNWPSLENSNDYTI